MIPARVRKFSDHTVGVVTRLSRTTRWRRRKHGQFPNPLEGGTTGQDVIDHEQARRAAAGLSKLSAEREEDLLTALVNVEDAYLARIDERAA